MHCCNCRETLKTHEAEDAKRLARALRDADARAMCDACIDEAQAFNRNMDEDDWQCDGDLIL